MESKLQKILIIVLKWTQWLCSARTGVPLQSQAGEVPIEPLYYDKREWRRICACFSKSRYSGKTFSTTERSAKKKRMLLCMCVLPAQFSCAWEAACWHSQHLTPATIDTIIIVLALLPKALLIMNQPRVAVMSIPAQVCHVSSSMMWAPWECGAQFW